MTNAKRLRQGLSQMIVWAMYPLTIYAGLRWGSPRIVGILLLLNLALRRRQDARKLMGELSWMDRGVVLGLFVLASVATVINSEILIRLFPVLMNFGALVLFARSLYASQSMVERFARLQEPNLPPSGVVYTRRVTQVWCLFLAVNTSVSWWTAMYATQEVWALYNGLITYVLMAFLFVGEWGVRSYLRPRAA
jgi:uncharacterized membrane protein